MTYYLTRYLLDGSVDKSPFLADNTAEALQLAKRLYEPRAMAHYAQVKDNQGRVVCTLSSNVKGPGRVTGAFQTEIPLPAEKWYQGELFT